MMKMRSENCLQAFIHNLINMPKLAELFEFDFVMLNILPFLRIRDISRIPKMIDLLRGEGSEYWGSSVLCMIWRRYIDLIPPLTRLQASQSAIVVTIRDEITHYSAFLNPDRNMFSRSDDYTQILEDRLKYLQAQHIHARYLHKQIEKKRALYYRVGLNIQNELIDHNEVN